MFRVSGSEWVSLRLRLGVCRLKLLPPPPPPHTHTHKYTQTHTHAQLLSVITYHLEHGTSDVEVVVGVEACSWSVMDSSLYLACIRKQSGCS